MKTHRTIALALLGFTTLSLHLSTLLAQGTVFTYQGRLTASPDGSGFTGTVEFQFTLWNAASAGNRVGVTNTVLASATNGLFSVPLDFGSAAFTGADRWLQIEARTTAGPFTLLNPRQRLTATPYAIYAGKAMMLDGALPGGQLAGGYFNVVTLNNPANVFAGNGAGLSGLDASQLASGFVPSTALSNAWKINGNAGTIGGTHFLGTTDNQPLDLRVNGVRALRLEPGGDSANDPDLQADGAPNVIGGSPKNFVAVGVVGATIGGGGATNYSGVAYTNAVLGDFGVVGGGLGNTIHGRAFFATIGGGRINTIQSNTSFTTIGGGTFNTIQADTAWATIGGGWNNNIEPNASGGTISGGLYNTIHSNAIDSTISGGALNRIQTEARWATIGGGGGNTIETNAEFATISGGWRNSIQTNAERATIGGGNDNTIQTDATYATIGGGFTNLIRIGAAYSTIGGGSYNIIGPDSMHAGIAGGDSNSIEDGADYAAIPGGRHAKASRYGQVAHASGRFANNGDAQASTYILRNTTSDATERELFLDGTSLRTILTVGATWTFDVMIAGRAANGESAGFAFRGVIENESGFTDFVDSPVSVMDKRNSGTTFWNATIQADDTNDALVIKVTGENGNTIRWVATVRTVEVVY